MGNWPPVIVGIAPPDPNILVSFYRYLCMTGLLSVKTVGLALESSLGLMGNSEMATSTSECRQSGSYAVLFAPSV